MGTWEDQAGVCAQLPSPHLSNKAGRVILVPIEHSRTRCTEHGAGKHRPVEPLALVLAVKDGRGKVKLADSPDS